MGNESFEIRQIADSDIKEVLEVYRRSEDFLALGPEPKASMEMVLQDMATSRQNKGVFCGIYAADGTMTGVIDYIPADFNGSIHVAFISLLMISAPFRNQGIGTRILGFVEDRIRIIGQALEIQTAVQLNNPAALRFWQRNGYRIFGNPERRDDQTVVSYLRKNLFSSG